MPTLGTVTTNELNALNNDGIFMVTAPGFRTSSHSALDARWTTTGTATGTDITDPTTPARRAYDGRLSEGTRASTTAVNDVYFNWTMPSVTVDSVVIYLSNIPTSITSVTLTVADNGSFTGGSVVNIASWSSVTSGSNSSGRRLVDLTLYDGTSANNARYTNVQYMRLQFNFAVATTSFPSLGQIIVGQRRQLSKKPMPPYNDQPDGVKVRSFTARSGEVTQVIDSEGYRHPEGSYEPTVDGIHSIDEVSVIRSIWQESRGQLIGWIENPSTSPNDVLFCRWNQSADGLSNGGFSEWSWDFSLLEQPPFLRNE